MMKYLFLSLSLLAGGCAVGAPPSRFERALYDVEETTQWVAKVSATTNEVGVVRWQTNVVPEPDYILHPRKAVVDGVTLGGSAASGLGFGLGGVVTSVLLGAYGAWASWRNARKGRLNAVLAQAVQTAREVIKATDGEELEEAFVESIKSAQRAADVKLMATVVVENHVDKEEARKTAAVLLRTPEVVSPLAATAP